jgi:Family of unknown function (DUF5317)
MIARQLAARILIARSPNRRAGDLAWLAIALACLVVQRITVLALGADGFEATVRRAVFLVAMPVLIIAALHFRRYLGAWLIAAGIAMNFAPMASHGGLMPVSWELIHASGAFPEFTEQDIGRQVPNSKDIVLLRSDIHLEPLSDRYLVSIPVYGANIYSAGDFVAFGGVALAALQIVALLFVPVRRGEGQRAAAEGGL